MTGAAAVDALPILRATGIVPVLSIKDGDGTVSAVRALADAGCLIAEVTLRSAGALESLRAAAEAHPEMAVGAGSVRDASSARAAIGAGAAFVVSPGLSEDVVETCLSVGVPVIPGVATATEVMRAIELGLKLLKLFPAEVLGGVPLINALSGPFPAVDFLPTGGINASLLPAYLRHPRVAAVGGSWMMPASTIAKGDFAAVSALTREALEVVKTCGAARQALQDVSS